MTLVGVVGVLALAGAPSAATRAAAQGRPAARALFFVRLPYATAAAAALGIAAGILALARPSPLSAALGVGALVLPLFVGGDVYPAHLIGSKRFGTYLRFQLLVQTLTLLAVVAAVAADPHAPWLAVAAVGGLTGIVQLRGLARLPHRRLEAGDLAYAKKLTALAMLAVVDVRLDILLSGFVLGAREASFVAVARTLPTLGKRIWEVGYQPLFVRLSELGEREALQRARRLRWPILAVLGTFAAVGVLAVPWLIPAVYGHRFHGAVHLSQLLLVAMVLMAAAYPEEVFFKAHGRFDRLTRVYVTLPVISFALLPPLVLLLGLTGIGVEALLVAAVDVVMILWLARGDGR